MGCFTAGAWEIQHDVLVGTLHTDITTISWACGFRNLIIPGRGAFLPVTGMPFDMSRNQIVEACLKGGFSHVYFLDSDTIPCHDAIVRLLRHNLPLVSGMYCRRSPPHSLPVMIRNGTWFTDFVPGSLVEVDMVGAGSMLVRRDLLEQMPPQRPEAGKHWYDWKVDMRSVIDPATGKPHTNCLSEDFSFCIHAKQTLGVKTYVDTSVISRHVGFAQSTFGSFVPMETTPNT